VKLEGFRQRGRAESEQHWGQVDDNVTGGPCVRTTRGGPAPTQRKRTRLKKQNTRRKLSKEKRGTGRGVDEVKEPKPGSRTKNRQRQRKEKGVMFPGKNLRTELDIQRQKSQRPATGGWYEAQTTKETRKLTRTWEKRTSVKTYDTVTRRAIQGGNLFQMGDPKNIANAKDKHRRSVNRKKKR